MTFKHENKKLREGFTHIIGCDEVGRGCLAGPVAAAAVILPIRAAGNKFQVESYKVIKSVGIKDSKLLTPDKREKLSAIIKQHTWWGIGVVDEKIIDKINIHHATLLAMKRAVEDLLCHCEPGVHPTGAAIFSRDKIASSPFDKLEAPRNDSIFLFIDGKFTIPDINIAQEAVVDGDNKILSVAAASIVAKVYRDDLMRKLHKQYPIYNFAQHKGYATLYHRQMVIEHGLSQIHRLSFCGHLLFPSLEGRG